VHLRALAQKPQRYGAADAFAGARHDDAWRIHGVLETN
jgi:hypothetical protein